MTTIIATPTDSNRLPTTVPAGTTITWVSSNPAEATLTPTVDGLSAEITQLGTGNIVITASAMNPDGTPLLGPDGVTTVTGSLPLSLSAGQVAMLILSVK